MVKRRPARTEAWPQPQWKPLGGIKTWLQGRPSCPTSQCSMDTLQNLMVRLSRRLASVIVTKRRWMGCPTCSYRWLVQPMQQRCTVCAQVLRREKALQFLLCQPRTFTPGSCLKQPQFHTAVLRTAPSGQLVFSALWEFNDTCWGRKVR